MTGGHIDEITGGRCSWNVFRICKTTTMEANAIADTLIRQVRHQVVFLTPDYVYGRVLQALFENKLKELWRYLGGKCSAARHGRLFARAQ